MRLNPLIAIILLLSTLVAVGAQPVGVRQPRDRLVEAYLAVYEAARCGGRVEGLVDRLNEALGLIRMAEERPEEAPRLNAEALRIVEGVLAEAPRVAEEGRVATLLWDLSLALAGVAMVVGGYAAYKYGPYLFLKLWVRAKSKYRVKVVGEPSSEHGSMILSEEVWAVVLAIVIVASVFAFSQAYMAGRVVEPFSELGILGPKAKIADYPRRVVAGDEVKLYLYVGNHLGYPAYYKVLVKLGNKTTRVDPAPLPPIATYEVILCHNQTWLHPISLRLYRVGEGQRLIFELWIYNVSVGGFTYHHRWCQLFIDVVPPP